MNKILTILLLTIGLFFASCNRGANDPALVLKDFFEAMSTENMSKAKSLVTTESRFTVDMIELAMKTSPGEIKMFNREGKDFGDAEIRGDLARVAVIDLETGTTLEFMLKKQEGKWKVLFDKDSFVEMGMGGLKNFNTDDASDVLDEIKHIDIDSLKKSFKKIRE